MEDTLDQIHVDSPSAAAKVSPESPEDINEGIDPSTGLPFFVVPYCGKLDNMTCANCWQLGHTVAQCPTPRLDGLVHGCPIHNESHGFNECPTLLAHNDETFSYYLWESRTDLPLLAFGDDEVARDEYRHRRSTFKSEFNIDKIMRLERIQTSTFLTPAGRRHALMNMPPAPTKTFKDTEWNAKVLKYEFASNEADRKARKRELNGRKERQKKAFMHEEWIEEQMLQEEKRRRVLNVSTEDNAYQSMLSSVYSTLDPNAEISREEENAFRDDLREKEGYDDSDMAIIPEPRAEPRPLWTHSLTHNFRPRPRPPKMVGTEEKASRQVPGNVPPQNTLESHEKKLQDARALLQEHAKDQKVQQVSDSQAAFDIDFVKTLRLGRKDKFTDSVLRNIGWKWEGTDDPAKILVQRGLDEMKASGDNGESWKRVEYIAINHNFATVTTNIEVDKHVLPQVPTNPKAKRVRGKKSQRRRDADRRAWAGKEYDESGLVCINCGELGHVMEDCPATMEPNPKRRKIHQDLEQNTESFSPGFEMPLTPALAIGKHAGVPEQEQDQEMGM